MKIAVETGGTIRADPGEVLDRPELEQLFDKLAEAVVELSEFEADVSIDFATRKVEFFVVVEADGLSEAIQKSEHVVTGAIRAAGVLEEVTWSGESHTRPADLVLA
ncbi:MAG TPA: hypothetical protein VHG90_09720 [Acidimicrobiales bacterium]|nr:hypothetical protein [Acidimicrobiales bacterium]